MDEELKPSELGTKNYWEKIYSQEITNFEEFGDVGEVWFGKNNALKVVKCISDTLKLTKADKIVDIGCGNGWTLMQLGKRGLTNLVGVDYAPTAINLTKAVLKDYQISLSTVELLVSDVLNPNDPLLSYQFKLAHDKGTYDAISLNPENSKEKRLTYIENMHKIIQPGGYLVLSSCNWTKDELLDHFQNHFDMVLTIPAPEIKFGSSAGQTVTNIVFKKK